MTEHAHVASLEHKHADLEAMIAEEAHRPHPDTIRITALKKAKLRIKEEMWRYGNA